MTLPRFEVLVPATIDEACTVLADQTGGARLLAGGTDLLVDLKLPIIPKELPRCEGCATHPQGGVVSTVACVTDGSDSDSTDGQPLCLVSLHKLAELRQIMLQADGRLEIGAMTTLTDIERSTEIRAKFTALAEGADSLGSPLVRNRGTLGGNIANARPAADALIPTIALGGQLTLKNSTGTRTVLAADFPVGPGRSTIKVDEILTAITFPAGLPHSGSAYYKLANRKALDISTVGVAVWLALEKPDGPVKEVRIALGAVGPTPLLAKSATEVLVGKVPNDKLLAEAAAAAADDAKPIDDHRGTAAYRLQMVETLTQRLLQTSLDRARGKA